MAKDVIVRLIIHPQNDDEVGKLAPAEPPNNGLGGTFIFKVENELGRQIRVEVKEFTPPGFVEINSPNPLTIKKNQTGLFSGKIIKSQREDTMVKYSIFLDGAKLDPDLIIDGDGSDVPPTKRRGKRGRKKGKRKKTTRKNSAAKSA